MQVMVAAIGFLSDAAVRWLSAIGVVVLTFVLAPAIGSRLTKLLSKPGPSERRRTMAAPAGRFVSTLCFTVGLVAFIGILSPSSLEPFPTKIVDFLPRLLIAILLLLVGSTFAGLGSGVVGVALARTTGKPQPALVRLTRSSIMLVIGLLSIGQLGVDTTVLDTLTQAVLFGLGAMVALLGALGGRDLAAEISAGRYVRRIVSPGDQIETPGATGRVKALHAATVELEEDEETSVHVPNALLMQSPLRVRRSRSTD
jgi:small-conductance mechanosensitive channel